MVGGVLVDSKLVSVRQHWLQSYSECIECVVAQSDDTEQRYFQACRESCLSRPWR